MKVAILGGTKGIGRAVAREMARRGDRLFLLGRDAEALSKSAVDLAAVGGQPVEHAHCDLLDVATIDPALDRAEAVLDPIETVILTAGLFATQDELETDAALRDRVLDVDFARSIAFCEAARQRLLARGGGTLCVVSSVAGDRARSPVVIYGAAKAGLSAYLTGLDHRFRRAGLRTISVRPGFVHTGMTAGLDPAPLAVEPEAVARVMLRAIDRGTPVVYAPPIYRWVMWVIRMLPRFVMRRVGF